MSADMPDGPPRGVATMAVVRWVLVAVAALVAVVSIASYFGAGRGGAAAAARRLRPYSSTPARCTRRSCRTIRASARSAT